MAKFGEIVNSKIPVLIYMYDPCALQEEIMHINLRDVASFVGDKAKVIKIDITKNETLANALVLKSKHNFFIYRDGEMKWRETGMHSTDQLLTPLKMYSNGKI